MSRNAADKYLKLFCETCEIGLGDANVGLVGAAR
jgi:hypothetical protein